MLAVLKDKEEAAAEESVCGGERGLKVGLNSKPSSGSPRSCSQYSKTGNRLHICMGERGGGGRELERAEAGGRGGEQGGRWAD